MKASLTRTAKLARPDTARRATDHAAEQAADRTADRVMAGTPARAACACGGSCPRCAALPRPLPRMLSGGEPLDAATRGFMEARFGADLGVVRVHTGTHAAASARAASARAYTAGADVVFGAGEYAPASRAGRHLLAHELAHVVQQARPGAVPAVQYKKDAAAPVPPKFYQYVIDEIATQEADQERQRKQVQFGFQVRVQLNFSALKALLRLAEAVDRGRLEDIPALVDAFIAADPGHPFPALSRGLLVELVARLFTLGLQAQGDKLRANYSQNEAEDSWIKSDTGLHARDVDIFRAIVERQVAAADHSTAASTRATLNQYLRILPLLRDELLTITEFEKGIGGDRRAATHGRWRWDGLVKVLGTLVSAMSAALQALIDRAATELGSGKTAEGTATLGIVRALVEQRIVPALNAPKANSDGRITIGDLKLVVAPSELTGGKGAIQDAFDPARTVAVSGYTPGQTGVQQLELPIVAVFDRRAHQVAAMARVFGATSLLRDSRPKEKERQADAQRNAATLKALFAEGGGLRLDNDDDWRRFVKRKHEELTTTGGLDDGQALRAVMDTLFDYLAAFTMHARFTDIYDRGDFKDAYFNKAFPKTLAGQLVHDCGVYAMRVAYILSLVRDELGLRMRFIRLPAHVGLVIEGDGLPTFIAHNNHFEEYSPERIDRIKRQLVAGGSGPIDDDRLTAEIAAYEFIEGPLDMPYFWADVPAGGGSAGATQRSLWRRYQGIAGEDVFGPASTRKGDPGYVFHKRYLAITQQFRDLHNDVLMPFWNEAAPSAWNALKRALVAGGRTSVAGSELDSLLATYLKIYDHGHQPLLDRYKSIEDQQRAIGKQLRKSPDLKAPKAEFTDAGRIAAIAPRATDLFRDRVAAALAAAKADPKREFEIAKLLDTDLAPPFMPHEEKKLFRYD